MTHSLWFRIAAVSSSVVLVGIAANVPAAQAVTRPQVDQRALPPDDPPAPERPMKRSAMCTIPMTIADPNVSLVAPGFDMLDVQGLWQYSTGNGVTVAVIDTGVNPNKRLPVSPGGDYVMGEDGLQDCDAHGTIVASIIAAAPQNEAIPMPDRMPAERAFPPPAAAPPVTSAPPPPDDAPPTPEPEPPPAPITITQVQPAPEPPPAPAPAPAEPVPADQAPVAPANAPGDEDGDTSEPSGNAAVDPPPPGANDGVAGVAPHAQLISIRQSSRAFSEEDPIQDPDGSLRKAGTVATLARAVVHAANMGAQVINISVTSCLSAADPLDQASLGAALWYAATQKDAVIVAAAGNDTDEGCAQNPLYDPMDPSDPRDWDGVKTVSSPSWFSDYVLSVGATDIEGAPIAASLAGPWVGVAAPGIDIMGLSPHGGGPVNAYPPSDPGDPNQPLAGTSFAAAYVSGVVALVRAKFPDLNYWEVINRIQQTAKNPARGVDNQVGYGVIDPRAALTYYVPQGERAAPGSETRIIQPPPPPVPPDHRARTIAVVFAGGLCGVVLIAALVARARRAR